MRAILWVACLWLVPLLSSSAIGNPPLDLNGHAVDPFASKSHVHVLLFVRTDCPVSRRYAPELQRLAEEFRPAPVDFWLVYPDASETSANIALAISQYHFPGTPVRDPHHILVAQAHATIAPEAAVFTPAGSLVYHGRIDDRYVDIGTSRPEAQVHDLEDAVKAALAGRPVKTPQTKAVGCYLADVD